MEGQEQARAAVLVAEAQAVWRKLAVMRRAAVTLYEHDRIVALVEAAERRISRRVYRYDCALVGEQPTTTVEIAAWVRANIHDYIVMDDVTYVTMAHAAADAFGLRESDGCVPTWVWGLCARIVPRVLQGVIRRRNFFVEKPIRYEADGDVIWA